MYQSKNLFFLQSMTSLHAGSGSSVSVIDLPVQREKFTGFPVIAGSGVKGVIREYCENTGIKGVDIIFGPEKDGSEYAGAAGFTDAKILFYPVKSVKGVFVWVTSPFVLERFMRDVQLTDSGFKLNIPVPGNEGAIVTKGCKCKIEGKIVLDEYDYTVGPAAFDDAEKIAALLFDKNSYWYTKFLESVVILTDDDFAHFVQYATEIQARIGIDNETGVVKTGALFYEENIPSETIFYVSLFVSNPHKKDELLKDHNNILTELKKLDNKFVHLGGDKTIGKGLMKIKFYNHS